MDSLQMTGSVADYPAAGYRFIPLKPDVQVAHSNFNLLTFHERPRPALTWLQVCIVCGSAEEDDDGACTSCGTVLPSGDVLSDIDGRAPAVGYQVTSSRCSSVPKRLRV